MNTVFIHVSDRHKNSSNTRQQKDNKLWSSVYHRKTDSKGLNEEFYKQKH